jgi:hypothetical protein
MAELTTFGTGIAGVLVGRSGVSGYLEHIYEGFSGSRYTRLNAPLKVNNGYCRSGSIRINTVR